MPRHAVIFRKDGFVWVCLDCGRDSKRDEVGVWIWVEKKTERKRKNWVLRARLWVLLVVLDLLLREKMHN